MPPAVDVCERLRRRIAQLQAQLRIELNRLENEPFPAQQAVIQANIERLLSQIDHEQALMEEMNCGLPSVPHPPPPPTLTIGIAGVEVTQAIQYHRAEQHLTDTADRGADNSVRLVANKPAWVRVYVHSSFSDLPGVTGTLEVQRRGFGFLYTTVTTVPAEPPGTTTARFSPNYDAERGSTASTLNFVIPAAHMIGRLRLRVAVAQPTYSVSAQTEVYLDVTLQQTLRLAGIMVGYNGSNGAPVNPVNITLPAPTLADLQATSAFTLTTMPVQSSATYRIAGTITWTIPLTDPATQPGGCSQNWLNLNSAVQQVRVSDGNQTNVIYYGLMAAGTPTGPVGGCNSGGVSTGPNGAQMTMAHEVGHYLGLQHAPCNVPGDPNYPAYEPYDPAGTPRASIGEYGLNINTGNVLSPQVFRDYMSYCGPGWISLYHHGLLMNNALLAPTIVGVEARWWRDYVMMDPNLIPEQWLPDPPPDALPWRRFQVDAERVISIVGVVSSEQDIQVHSVARVAAVRELPHAKETELVAELLDEGGERLAVAPLYRLPSRAHSGCCCRDAEGGGDRPPYLFQAFLADVAPGAELRIRRGDDRLWVRTAPEAPPALEGIRADVRPRGLAIEWTARAETGEEPEVWAQWSPDQGKTWHSLAIGLRGGSAEIDASTLPPGRVWLRLLAHDGFSTETSELITVDVPTRSPSLAILHPWGGSTAEAGSPLRLWGSATHPSGEPVGSGFARWLLDGQEVGRGFDVFIRAPEEGSHRCSLIVQVGGESAEASVEFQTVAVPREP